MITVVLLVFAALVTFSALRWLAVAAWTSRAPRLGIAAWYAVLGTVAIAIISAIAEALIPLPGATPAWCDAVIWCAEAMDDTHSPTAGFTARLLASLTAFAAMLTAIRVLHGARAVAQDRTRHRNAVCLAGRVREDLDATVIDHPQPAAYVISGRTCRVVVTSGALRHLSAAQLAAVLAHERAHAAGHHQLLLDVVRVTAAALPRFTVIATARDQVERLIEIRADDVAARRHRRVDLAHALVTMATTHHRESAAPPTGLAAATGGDATERLHRLMRPPRRLHHAVSVPSWAAVAVLPGVPLALAAACRWWPPLATCLWGA
ncbi:hypothetical protein DMB66_07260 [Actinoplanes sp. ATCC 53533]|uniref:M56 family metallopeptidase n=1 Tax=Actinoplanes sp. ATCC 53533 TaxID=1288362 RepID=UPI000F7A3BB3|nr:M56 family metallopeptidase [Actinoplanes sp. ATCC 53533]RSM71636.1 hypothetical protein DMB66_07260 [Actinoplanes sp. ATCC 53533]